MTTEPARVTSISVSAERWLAKGCGQWLDHRSVITTEGKLRKLKSICEILFWESHVSRFPSKALFAYCVKALQSWLRDGTLYTFAYRFPQFDTLSLIAFYLVRTHLPITPKQDRDLERLASFLIEAPSERLPFRKLDLLHGTYLFFKRPFPSQKMIEIAGYGCLNSPLDTTRFTTSDEYALTHTIFYLTDFGRRAWPSKLIARDELAQIVTNLSQLAVAERNYDLLSEYLIAAHMASLDRFDYEEYVPILTEAFSAGGVCPGPLEMRAQLLRDGLPNASADFFQNYHTTFLARDALLRAAALRKRRILSSGHQLKLESNHPQATVPFARQRSLKHRELSGALSLGALYEALLNGSPLRLSDRKLVNYLNNPITVNLFLEAFCLTKKLDPFLTSSGPLRKSIMGLAEFKLKPTTAAPSLLRALSAANAIGVRHYGIKAQPSTAGAISSRIMSIWPRVQSSLTRVGPAVVSLCDQLVDLMVAWHLQTFSNEEKHPGAEDELAARLVRYLMRIRSHRQVCTLMAFANFECDKVAAREYGRFLRSANSETLSFGWIPSHTITDATAAYLSDMAFLQLSLRKSMKNLS